jgi:hypothetical protein
MQWFASAAVAVFALAATHGIASAQSGQVAQGINPGAVYTLHSRAQGSCPSLDWHLVVGPNNTLSGMVAWDDMKMMARATGTLDMSKRTFMLTAKEVGGEGRTAMVDGTVRMDGWFIANISGPGVACKEIKVPLNAQQSVGGGG